MAILPLYLALPRSRNEVGVVHEAHHDLRVGRPVGLESCPWRLEGSRQQVLVVGDYTEIVILKAAALGQQHRFRVQERGDGERWVPTLRHRLGRDHRINHVRIADRGAESLLEARIHHVGLLQAIAPRPARRGDGERVLRPGRAHPAQLSRRYRRRPEAHGSHHVSSGNVLVHDAPPSQTVQCPPIGPACQWGTPARSRPGQPGPHAISPGKGLSKGPADNAAKEDDRCRLRRAVRMVCPSS
jgi:hypothetical protein